MNERALSLDLDGVVFGRIPFQLKALVRRHIQRKGSSIYDPPDELPQILREEVGDSLKISEWLNYFMHKIRGVPDDVVRGVQILSQQGVDIYGNTGRSSRTPWVDLTRSALERNGLLDYFEAIYFKPEGLKTRDSKIDAVIALGQKYEQVVHFDDNPEDALPMAKMLPEVKVVIVQDKSTGLLYSREEALRYPNVTRVATFGKGADLLIDNF